MELQLCTIIYEFFFLSPFFPFSLQSVDFEAVAVTVKELVNYALTINSNNHFWLIIQADIYFGKQHQHLL